MRTMIRYALTVMTALIAQPAHAKADNIAGGLRVEMTSPPVLAGELANRQLVYELHIVNLASSPHRITNITVRNEKGEMLYSLERDSLHKAMAPFGAPFGGAAGNDAALVPSGQRWVVYINAPVGDKSPSHITHQVAYEKKGVRQDLVVAKAPVLSAMPTLGPPLRGGPWVGLYDPTMPRGHRRVFYGDEKRPRIPGRFAIDWIRLDDKGRMAKGNGTRADHSHGYGADVLAVADGRVVAVRKDVAQVALLKDIPDVSIRDATGNYITLDIGNGWYVFYEHLLPEITVTIGDRVKRGAQIGKLGITGQGSEPHLHFHVANANSPLNAEGRPWLMTGIRHLGGYGSIAEAVKGVPWKPVPTTQFDQVKAIFPKPNQVVQFPD